ncbi:MAG: hypothetical protein EP345_04665 [Sphingomonadales bacterium]|nr:MAG: hypothetical protein EP345_04665 [Sphingomonadales bacterium]
MTDVNTAISEEALLGKSRAYIAKALRRKGEQDLEEYQLWASLALELLGKAALAHRHPCLVVDPTHSPSLFVAAGVSATTDVKTITAKTLFERLRHLIPAFDENVRQNCQAISERRNAELHSGDVPFKAMKVEAWEARYWYACNITLASMGRNLDDWIGEGEAKEKQQLLAIAAEKLKASVAVKIEAAKVKIQGTSQKTRDQLIEEAAARSAVHYSDLFKWANDNTWEAKCIVCTAKGFLAGDSVSEEVIEETYDDGPWETVEITYSADEFACPVCDLHLTGQAEVLAAGYELEHAETDERQIEYEPEYGNC